VLVIEADPDLRALLADLLAAEGYAVAAAQGEADGLDAVRNLHPEMLLLDIGPEAGRGLELLERLRAGEPTRYIPVLAITGQAPEAVAGLPARLDGVLRMPFDLDVLLAQVGQVARAHPGAARAAPGEQCRAGRASIGAASR
jgi:two-component system response regulator MprA